MNPVEKAVCTDPALSAADAQLTQRLADVMSRSLDPGQLDDEQRQWLGRLGQGEADSATIAAAYQSRLGQLDRQMAWLDKIEPARTTTEDAARSTCPALFNDPAGSVGACTVSEFGTAGSVGGHEFFYGLYGYNDAIGVRVVLYERLPGGELHALFAPQEAGGFFSRPAIFVSAGHTLLHLPGYESGTGNFNLERMFIWRAAAWTFIDAAGWGRDLTRRLPKGYDVWKGVFPDYRKMTGTTPLWRQSDGFCCPTGGRADFTLGWQGDRLTVKSVQIKLGAKYAQ
ncbi:MAG TPA: hypothetical protein VNV38_02065 [Stellaceae bacterium]|nr:hypothetical protein [Stellaceae bacterium]